jgi:hypothetical protein
LEALSFSVANIRDSVILDVKCTTSHLCFRIALVSDAINKDTASSVLFHNCTTYHACFRVDFGSATKTAMATEAEMEWSAFLNHMFDDALDLYMSKLQDLWPQILHLQNTAGFVGQHLYPQIQQDSWDGATIFGQHESCFGPDSVVV